EVWLLFGPDGTFQRTEKAITIPLMNHTRRAPAPPQPAVPSAPSSSAEPVPVAPHPSPQPVDAPAVHAMPIENNAGMPVAGGPLLPPGTTYVPGVSYPIRPH